MGNSFTLIHEQFAITTLIPIKLNIFYSSAPSFSSLKATLERKYKTRHILARLKTIGLNLIYLILMIKYCVWDWMKSGYVILGWDKNRNYLSTKMANLSYNYATPAAANQQTYGASRVFVSPQGRSPLCGKWFVTSVLPKDVLRSYVPFKKRISFRSPSSWLLSQPE